MDLPDAATFTVHYLAQAPPDVRRLAERLSRAQGCKVRVAAERSGFQIYLPCPSCLHTHGESEMYDPKYVVNAQKYLGIGAFRDETAYGAGFDPVRANRSTESDSERNWRSGVCMRTRDSASNRHIHSMDELLSGPTITERHPDIHTRAAISFSGGSDDREKFWDRDETTGVMRPPSAGVVIPLNILPGTHPAIEYVVGRGFCPHRLYEQFRAGFCVKEYPSSEEKQIFYRRMVAGWRDTPQHRIIFHALHQGTPMTWQGRYIEKLSPSGLEKFALHPYAKPFRWDLVAVRANLKAAWIPVSPFDEVDADGKPRWEPAKYKTAKHSTRELMGWDAALKRAEADPELLKWCVMVEGPLDGARVGPGGVILIGKSITPDNAAKVARHFHMAFTAFDNDRAGREATEKVTRALLASHRSSLLQHVAPLEIPDGKDLGEMAQAVFDGIMMRALKSSGQGGGCDRATRKHEGEDRRGVGAPGGGGAGIAGWESLIMTIRIVADTFGQVAAEAGMRTWMPRTSIGRTGLTTPKRFFSTSEEAHGFDLVGVKREAFEYPADCRVEGERIKLLHTSLKNSPKGARGKQVELTDWLRRGRIRASGEDCRRPPMPFPGSLEHRNEIQTQDAGPQCLKIDESNATGAISVSNHLC